MSVVVKGYTICSGDAPGEEYFFPVPSRISELRGHVVVVDRLLFPISLRSLSRGSEAPGLRTRGAPLFVHIVEQHYVTGRNWHQPRSGEEDELEGLERSIGQGLPGRPSDIGGGSQATQGQALCTQALGQRGQATGVLTDAAGPAVQAV